MAVRRAAEDGQVGRKHRLAIFAYVSAGCGVLALLSPTRSGTFTEPAYSRALSKSSEQLSRASVARLLPAATLGIASTPSFADSGVTQAWGKTPSGEEDTFHTGGVEWEDIKVGTGASPQIGKLMAINFVVKAYVRDMEVTVDDTKGSPRDYRWGVGQLPAGIDEGIKGMRTGGVRKMRIPGNLAFGKRAIPPAVGRPAVPANTPLEATVTLEFIPGADDVYEAYTDPYDTAS